MDRIPRALLFSLAVCMMLTNAVSAQPISRLPGPSESRMVIDHARIIPEFAKGQLENFCREIRGFEESELVILTVNDTGGIDPEKYAVDYFNKWQIGTRQKNNGLLVMAAMRQRTAFIAIGDGLKSEANYRKCEEIARDVMVARFKRNDSAGAMYGGAFAAARDILGYRDLADRLERETGMDGRLRKSTARGHKMFFWWLAGGGVLGIGGISLLISRYKVRYGARSCEQCKSEMVMLDEQADDSFLEEGEAVEERLGSADYDVWACLQCDHVLKYRYGRFWTRYSNCPRCRYKTKNKISHTIRAATTELGGLVRVNEECANCRFHKAYTYSTPKKPKPSSDSGSWSSGSWSGGGSWGGGSSGGGSWGGGGSSSGGGGASW